MGKVKDIDPKIIRGVAMNFVTNAISYTKKGFVKLTVEKEKNEVVLKVVDPGIGVPKANKAISSASFSEPIMPRVSDQAG